MWIESKHSQTLDFRRVLFHITGDVNFLKNCRARPKELVFCLTGTRAASNMLLETVILCLAWSSYANGLSQPPSTHHSSRRALKRSPTVDESHDLLGVGLSKRMIEPFQSTFGGAGRSETMRPGGKAVASPTRTPLVQYKLHEARTKSVQPKGLPPYVMEACAAYGVARAAQDCWAYLRKVRAAGTVRARWH